ncbi:DMT family transporter [Frigidibacter sp. ROC022]|uniref:DMT family transporter n=1 Tax=Frigidibacter sp. ROC022 TaxID=2971796 RepID=UPI00215A0F12|nr:DMT family transporter [Frigidibacter sp. ROC022]MCR8724751.1 DMT family transporter [Frigidibacter sp. ROC022]
MDIRSLLMGLSFAFIWSSAFTSARYIVLEAPPLSSLALRFTVSGLIGIALARMLGQSWRLSRGQWRATVVFGLCQNALYLGFYWVAMQWVEAGLASILAATMPLIVAALGWGLYREKVPPLGLAGLVAGFAGVALIMGSRLNGGADPLGLVFCVIGVLALAVATLSMRGASSGGNVLMVVGLQMLIGAAALTPFALTESWTTPPSTTFIVAFAYTVLAPGLLATWIWFRLVARIGATRAATFHFLNPVFGVGIAAVLLGERMSLLDLVGVVIVTLGILAVQLSARPGAAARRAAREAGGEGASPAGLGRTP